MNYTFPFKSSSIAKAFSEHVHTGKFQLKGVDAASVLELLYDAYSDVQGHDPAEIDNGFINLENHLERTSLNENNEIFGIVCNLCDAYEKRAFIDAIQIGAYLMLELQSN